jgi:hypothetical protein
MKVYHGSPKSGLKVLEFSPELSRFVENLVEGEGIYLTEDLEVAKNYASGGSVYEVEIGSQNILDAQSTEAFEKILEETSEHFGLGFNINTIRYVAEAIQVIIDGGASISEFGNSIRLILDNDEITMMYFEENGGYEQTLAIAEYIRKKIHDFDGFRYIDRGINNGNSAIFVIKNQAVISIKNEIKIKSE